MIKYTDFYLASNFTCLILSNNKTLVLVLTHVLFCIQFQQLSTSAPNYYFLNLSKNSFQRDSRIRPPLREHYAINVWSRYSKQGHVIWFFFLWVILFFVRLPLPPLIFFLFTPAFSAALHCPFTPAVVCTKTDFQSVNHHVLPADSRISFADHRGPISRVILRV